MGEKPKKKVEDFDIEEPQNQEEYLKFIYRDMKAVKNVLFGAEGLDKRTERLETTMRVLAWMCPILGGLVGWIITLLTGGPR